MLCHQHPAEPAHAACQRCQRGLCRSCTKLFLQRLCTHCVEQSVSKRTREARRTLWLSLPVFALAAWVTAMSLPPLAPRPHLYFAMLAGMLALGAWVGLRRWRRAPSLAGGSASVPDSETPWLERVVVPVLAGIAFWPWLWVETMHDLRLANRLRAYVPPQDRESTFGLGEASLALASVATAFTLGTHGLSSYTPVAEKLWATEASLADSAERAVRAKLEAGAEHAAQPALGVPEQAPSTTARAPAPQGVAEAEVPASPQQADVAPEIPAGADAVDPGEAHAHGHHHARHTAAHEGEPEVHEPLPVEEEKPGSAEPPSEVEAPAPLDRRYVPGSEMARQAQSGNRTPSGTYVTSTGRVVMPAPPPPQ